MAIFSFTFSIRIGWTLRNVNYYLSARLYLHQMIFLKAAALPLYPAAVDNAMKEGLADLLFQPWLKENNNVVN